MSNELISKALKELGFTSGWTVSGETLEGIEWIVEPAVKPTTKAIEEMIAKLPEIQAQKAQAQLAEKQAILDRLGITADEAKLILS